VKIALLIVVIAVLFFVGLLTCIISPRGIQSSSTNEHGLLPLTARTRQTKNITTFTVFWDDLVRRILGRRLGEYGIKREHEQALMRLGYLTTNDFVLTNQLLTVEFGSNFWRMLRERYGTNRKAIWMYHNNRDRIHATLPAKDLAEWERIFRECAARYASNVPPVAITNATN
jgi:hypothetical protein